MSTFPSFAVAAAPWQNFYILAGTAAATLIGLMFVAITFGASLITRETSDTARAFIDPTFTHFVQVLLCACFALMPTIGATVIGLLLIAIAVLRAAALFRIHRHMTAAQKRSNDLEISDWISGIVIPALAYLTLAAAGASFIAGWTAAFNALAAATIVILLNGIYGAWEMMVWMAVMRAPTKS